MRTFIFIPLPGEAASKMVWAATRTFDDGDLFVVISELLSGNVSQYFSIIWTAIAIWLIRLIA